MLTTIGFHGLTWLSGMACMFALMSRPRRLARRFTHVKDVARTHGRTMPYEVWEVIAPHEPE